jgi:hypothetical protein
VARRRRQVSTRTEPITAAAAIGHTTSATRMRNRMSSGYFARVTRTSGETCSTVVWSWSVCISAIRVSTPSTPSARANTARYPSASKTPAIASNATPATKTRASWSGPAQSSTRV